MLHGLYHVLIVLFTILVGLAVVCCPQLVHESEVSKECTDETYESILNLQPKNMLFICSAMSVPSISPRAVFLDNGRILLRHSKFAVVVACNQGKIFEIVLRLLVRAK